MRSLLLHAISRFGGGDGIGRFQEEVQGHRYMGGNALNADNFQVRVIEFVRQHVDVHANAVSETP